MFWKLRNKNYLTKNLILSWVFYPPVHPINHFKKSSNPSIAEDKVSINKTLTKFARSSVSGSTTQ